MADDKKKEAPSEGGGSDFFAKLAPPIMNAKGEFTPGKLFGWFFMIFLVMFAIWWATGGPARVESIDKPYLQGATGLGSPFTPYDTAQEQQTQLANGWHTLAVKDFNVNLPPGWYVQVTKEEHLVYRANFTNGKIALPFEYGLYTVPDADEKDPRFTMHKESVDGKTATIYMPKYVGAKTIVYFDRYPQNESLEISGVALSSSNQTLLLGIARSVHFGK